MRLAALLGASLCVGLAAAATPVPDSTVPSLWPQPKSLSSGNAWTTAVPSSEFFKSTKVSATLSAAFERYLSLTFPHATAAGWGGRRRRRRLRNSVEQVIVSDSFDIATRSLLVDWESGDESHPQLSTDESYVLDLGTDGYASLSAKTIYGVMRGLETFSQIVKFDFGTEQYRIDGLPMKIEDSPRFSHRGLMVDTARHFEPLASLRAMIDSLPYAKINVLHWHMVDQQSFPFQSKSFPALWSGAYSADERYTERDIASIVEYARMRGVRVMVEFDVPGHAASWCAGYPEICPSSTCQMPLNVANNKTFEVIDGILGDCTGRKKSAPGAPSGLFPDDFIHLGGDEVDTSCWTKTPAVASWLSSRNMSGDDGYAYFVKKAAGIAISQGRRPVQWSEVYDHFKTKLDKRTVVHIWKAVTNVTEVLADGYNVLLNVGYDDQSWYLDNLNINSSAVYSKEPCDGVPDNLCPLILGGHGEMWGETVDTSDIQQTVWPRLAAIAEKLWSPRAKTGSYASRHDALRSFRCLLNRRGVAAAPVDNADARTAPPGPAGCETQ